MLFCCWAKWGHNETETHGPPWTEWMRSGCGGRFPLEGTNLGGSPLFPNTPRPHKETFQLFLNIKAILESAGKRRQGRERGPFITASATQFSAALTSLVWQGKVSVAKVNSSRLCGHSTVRALWGASKLGCCIDKAIGAGVRRQHSWWQAPTK